MHGEKHHAAGSALARQTQCGGKQGVQDTDRQVRLEPGLCSVRATGRTVGVTEGGLVCIQADEAMPGVFQLETGSAGSGHGCLSAAMEKSGSICESSLELGGEDIDDCDASGSEGCAGGSCVDGAALVSNTAGDGDRGAENAATEAGNESLILGDTISSRMAHIRRGCTVEGLSEEASILVERSWRKRTNRAYDTSSVCGIAGGGRNIKPASCSVGEVVNFLASLVE